MSERGWKRDRTADGGGADEPFRPVDGGEVEQPIEEREFDGLVDGHAVDIACANKRREEKHSVHEVVATG